MTLPSCLTRLDTLAAAECPDDYITSLNSIRVGDAILKALTIHYTGPTDVPREATLVFGLNDQLTFATVLDPRRFQNAIEEGLSFEIAEGVAVVKVESFEDVIRYLRGEAYQRA